MVRVPIGVTNPWMAIGQLGVFLLMVFFADASVTAWRRGRRAAAVVVGSILTLLMLSGGGLAVVLYWGGVQAPNTLTLFCLGIVVVMAYALSTDLLRAKQLVVELSEKEQEAALAAEAANLGTFTRDIPRDVIEASDEWRELFGFTPDEPLTLSALMQQDPRRRSGGVRREHGAGDPGRAGTARRVPGAAADGRIRWIAAIGRVEFDSRGRPVRSRGACIDITSRKQAEQEMLRLRQDIAHVGRVSVMGQLASALAHEINQPLGAILRNAEAAALFMQDPSPDLAEITAILEDIRKDDQRAGAVIDRMRALLRRQEVEMKPLDVPQMLDDVATLLRPDAAARHIALEIDVPPDLPPVHGDRVQLQQVLLNLILNGMDALGAEGGDRRKVARDGAAPGTQHPGIQRRRHRHRHSRQRRSSTSSTRSSPPSRPASAWDCRSRAASSRPTAAASGRRTTPRAGRPSASRFRSRPDRDPGLQAGRDPPVGGIIDDAASSHPRAGPMSLVTIVYSMIAGVCFTLAAVHLPVWLRNREARATLAFAVAAVCSGAIACGELLMLTAATPAEYAAAQKWNNVPIALLLVALAALRLPLPARRPALAGDDRDRPAAGRHWRSISASARTSTSSRSRRWSVDSLPGRGGGRRDRREQPLDGDHPARRVRADAVLRRCEPHRLAPRPPDRGAPGRRQPDVLHAGKRRPFRAGRSGWGSRLPEHGQPVLARRRARHRPTR